MKINQNVIFVNLSGKNSDPKNFIYLNFNGPIKMLYFENTVLKEFELNEFKFFFPYFFNKFNKNFDFYSNLNNKYK